MQCTIFKWLLGIWLIQTVVGRHIQSGEEASGINAEINIRNGRVQTHRQPFYNSPHFSYNSFMSSVRDRRRPQSRIRNLVEAETSNTNSNDHHSQQFNNHYSNYFTANTDLHHQNQQNLNVYSAVRLHGAIEARAKAEPGSNTLVGTTSHYPHLHHTSNYYQHPPFLHSRNPFFPSSDRQRRREDPPPPKVDGESYERDDNELARFSLYNSYFDNEHSIKALNSMKCVTPTGSPGFCSTFRGCVPSFFTKEGDLEAPALAELISTSIGYCTTNITHHYIREQREHFFSREERRFNSVANRIICCPGIAPVRDPNQDPDKIFNDYLESQRRKSTTTTTISPENVASDASESMSHNDDATASSSNSQQEQTPVPTENEDEQTTTQSQIQDGSQSDDAAQQQPSGPVESSTVSVDASDASSSPVDSATSQQTTSEPSQAASDEPFTTVQPQEVSMIKESTSEGSSSQDVSVPATHKPAMQGEESEQTESAAGSSQQPSISSSPLPPVETISEGQSQADETEQESSPTDVPPTTTPATESESSSSQSPENNNEPKPVHPSAGKPIIIVQRPANAGGMMPIVPGMMLPSSSPEKIPMMPSFPAEFPPMGSEESQVPPVDDSSLELQPRPPPTSSSTSAQPSSSSAATTLPTTVSHYPETSSQASDASSSHDETNLPSQDSTNESDSSLPVTTTNDPSFSSSPTSSSGIEVVATTQDSIISSGNENIMQQQQQDESDAPLTTTFRPQQPVVDGEEVSPSGDFVTTNAPPQFDDEDGNDALTILPIQDSASEKSGSTTELSADSLITTVKPMPSEGGMIAQSQQQPGSPGAEAGIAEAAAGGNEVATTFPVSGSSSVSTQEVEVTTLQPVPETTTIVATTQPPIDSNESDESSEEQVTNANVGINDIQKTTLSPEVDNNNDVNPEPTTVQPEAANVAHDEENLPEVTNPPSSPSGGAPVIEMGAEQSTGLPPNSESLVTGTPSGGSGVAESEANGTGHDQPLEEPEGQVSDTVQPFPASSPAPPAGGEQPFPGDQQQHDPSESAQQPFPESESDQQRPVSDAEPNTTSVPGSDLQEQPQVTDHTIPGSETASSPVSSQAIHDGVSTGLPTTSSPINVEQDGGSADGIVPVERETTINPVVGNGQPSADDDESHVPIRESPTTSPTAESESSGAPADVSETAPVSGAESTSEGSHSSYPATESSTVQGAGASENDSGIVSTASPDDIHQADQPASRTTQEGEQEATSSSSAVQPDSSSPIPDEAPVPSHDDTSLPTESNGSSDNESFVSSTSSATTAPESTSSPASESGEVTEAERISEETLPPVSADSAQDAPSMPEPDAQHSSVSPPHVQDPQSVQPTTEVPQDVSTPASVPVSNNDQHEGSAGESANNSSSSFIPPYPGMEMTTASTVAPSEKPVAIQAEPSYQILKACKFQSYFRTMMEDEMDFSYRHYPWLATIVGGTRPFSSGTLITDRHILTASHFLSNITVSDVFNMRIHVGYRTSYTGNTEGPYAVRKVKKVIRHKGFSFEKLYNDIAVLVLDRPVRFSEDIYPVCISSNRDSYSDGTAEAFETGWIEDPRTYTISQHHNYVDPHIQKYFSFGYKNITWRLQEASQRVRTNEECQSNYGFLEKNGISVTDSMVCAGSGDTRSCAFRGNSGAPLFQRQEGDAKMTQQIGIVSWGIGCGHFPFVFTRVESFLPWLDRVVYNSR